MEEQNYEWLEALQDDVGVWAEENFDDQPYTYPMIGAGEEIGELTTSVLKRQQGIDDADKYQGRVGDEPERDAVGDITIYLLDMMHRIDADMLAEKIVSGHDALDFSDIDGVVPCIRTLYSEYGFLTSKADDEVSAGDKPREEMMPMINSDVALVIIVLERFCEIRGFDYKSCVIDAWEEVSGREWDADVK